MRTRVRYPDGMPSFDKMIIPTLQALLDLGGTATVEEIQEAVVQRHHNALIGTMRRGL
jgi:hypothetical protein